jgi:hypothetical protein
LHWKCLLKFARRRWLSNQLLFFSFIELKIICHVHLTKHAVQLLILFAWLPTVIAYQGRTVLFSA